MSGKKPGLRIRAFLTCVGACTVALFVVLLGIANSEAVFHTGQDIVGWIMGEAHSLGSGHSLAAGLSVGFVGVMLFATYLHFRSSLARMFDPRIVLGISVAMVLTAVLLAYTASQIGNHHGHNLIAEVHSTPVGPPPILNRQAPTLNNPEPGGLTKPKGSSTGRADGRFGGAASQDVDLVPHRGLAQSSIPPVRSVASTVNPAAKAASLPSKPNTSSTIEPNQQPESETSEAEKALADSSSGTATTTSASATSQATVLGSSSIASAFNGSLLSLSNIFSGGGVVVGSGSASGGGVVVGSGDASGGGVVVGSGSASGGGVVVGSGSTSLGSTSGQGDEEVGGSSQGDEAVESNEAGEVGEGETGES